MSQLSQRRPESAGSGLAPLRHNSRTVRVFAVVAGLCVSNLYYVIVLLPEIAASHHRPSQDFAHLLSLTQGGYTLGLLFVVPLGDRVERRRLCTLLLAAACLVCAAVPCAPTGAYPVLFVLLGLCSVTAMVLVPWGADLADDSARGRVVGTIMTGLILGTLLCRTVAGAIAQLASWRFVYGSAAVLMALCVAALYWGLPSGAVMDRRRPRDAQGESYLRLLGSLPRILLRVPGVGERSLYGALAFGAFSAFWAVLPLHLQAPPFSFGPAEIGLFALLGGAGVVGASAAGRLADRGLQAPTTLAAFATVVATFLVLGAWPRSLALLIVGTVVLDMGIQVAHITNQSVIYAGNPAMRSRITTTYMVMYFVGGTLGSAVAATVWGRGGSWGATCLVGAGMGAGALAVAVLRTGLGRLRGRGTDGVRP
ncbi:MFS transporter [Streptomyces sp. NPDC001507]|uniref:MFS transporter n=1 Tax=Streptomyces sp. NPDC001507 TaxID=3364579 RepID=UPI0036B5C314